MKVKHSPERDKIIFETVERAYSSPRRAGRLDVDDETVMELLSIAKKWRSKSIMRQARLEEILATHTEI